TKLTEVVEKVFDFRPLAIIEKLGLRNPVFSETASYGHFGRTGFSWEKTDMTEILTDLIG
ncbi:MAG: methionine adenosyltransferase domain-containing protein, partial [Christensenellales bacterium]